MADQPQSPIDDGTSSPAYPILAGDSALSDENRADLFDIFHQSKDPAELTQKLQTLAVPEDTKKRLLTAKQSLMPPVDPVASVLSVGTAMKSVDPATLDLMESHPTVFKTLAAAAAPAKPAKEGKPSPGSQTAGNQPAEGKNLPPSPLVQPPRPDGMPHLPPIDPSVYRVLSSDGGLHDIPKERLEEARALDPKLHVLNP